MPVDPWDGSPLFGSAHELQAAKARIVFDAGRASVTW